MITKIIKYAFYCVKKFLNTFYCLCRYKGDIILIDAWINQWFGKLDSRNFGDELNVYIIEQLTGKRVVNRRNTFLNGIRFLVIGSIVEFYSSSKSIIWGSGAMYGNSSKKIIKPRAVLAVRGQYTRDYLLRHQIECPAIYGDPALLLPYVYNKNVKKKYKYGLIPHVADLDNSIIKSFMQKSKNQIHLISFQNYGDWHNVIDQIKSCENIISSSLHGLIVSDAYGIPNVWIKISDNINGGEFKFKDYFSGVKREYKPPIVMTEETTLSAIDLVLSTYKKISPDLKSLINTCPWKINNKSIEQLFLKNS